MLFPWKPCSNVRMANKRTVLYVVVVQFGLTVLSVCLFGATLGLGKWGTGGIVPIARKAPVQVPQARWWKFSYIVTLLTFVLGITLSSEGVLCRWKRLCCMGVPHIVIRSIQACVALRKLTVQILDRKLLQEHACNSALCCHTSLKAEFLYVRPR